MFLSSFIFIIFMAFFPVVLRVYVCFIFHIINIYLPLTLTANRKLEHISIWLLLHNNHPDVILADFLVFLFFSLSFHLNHISSLLYIFPISCVFFFSVCVVSFLDEWRNVHTLEVKYFWLNAEMSVQIVT